MFMRDIPFSWGNVQQQREHLDRYMLQPETVSRKSLCWNHFLDGFKRKRIFVKTMLSFEHL